MHVLLMQAHQYKCGQKVASEVSVVFLNVFIQFLQ